MNKLTHPLLLLVSINLVPQIWLRPLWASALAAIFIGYRFFVEYKQIPVPPRWTMWVAQGVVTATIWNHYHSLFGDEASGTLLTLLACLKTYELRRKRDYFFNAMLCFLVLMSYLLIDQSLTLTVFLLLDVILIFTFLYALESETWSWKSGKRFLRPTLGLALKALPLLVICFVLFPRFSTGFGTGADVNAKTGITDKLQPGSVAGLISSDELVFRATFLNGEMPAKSALYWRGAILDTSKGLNWERTKIAEKVSPPVAAGDRKDIEIYLEPGFEKFLFSLDSTRTVSFPTDLNRTRVNQREGGTFELDQPLQNRERYVLEYEPDQQQTLDSETLQKYLQTEDEMSSQMQDLLQKLKGRNNSETVGNVLRHFRSDGYVYTLQPPRAANVDEFMFKNKVGFCEHYAGAMATMLRHMGVPARVVVGFQGGTPSFLENYISVRGHDAHAWVEYFDNEGNRWRRSDPTAQVAPMRLARGSQSYLQNTNGWLPKWLVSGDNSTYQRARALLDEIEANWIGFLLRFDLARQKELLAKFGMEETIFRALPVFLLLALALTMAVLYFIEAQRREHLPVEERLYRDLLRRLKKWNIQKGASEGPLALMDKLYRSDPVLATHVEPILETLILARFADYKLSPSDRDKLTHKMRALKKLSIKGA